MAADLEKLKGLITEDTDAQPDEMEVERLIIGLLRSLLEEQKNGIDETKA